jgi:transposase
LPPKLWEDRIPADQPLPAVLTLMDSTLRERSPRFGVLYRERSSPSIPPELLLRALLLQMRNTMPSERKLVE